MVASKWIRERGPRMALAMSFCLALLLVAPAAALGQFGWGEIGGTLTALDYTGRVRTPDDVTVVLYQHSAGQEVEVERTEAFFGRYSFSFVDPGQYHIGFESSGNWWDTEYAPRFYKGKEMLQQADVVTVADDDHVCDETLYEADAAVSGRVTNQNGTDGIGGVLVEALDPSTGQVLASARTSGLGYYSWVMHYGPVKFRYTLAGYRTQYYQDADSFGQAKTVNVPPAGNLANIDAHLSKQSAQTIYTEIEGPDRYQTALRISQHTFSQADTVIITTGRNWPDALGGSALGGKLRAPLLLTSPTSLTGGITGEIRRLGAKKAIILGSAAAVSSGVETALKIELGGPNVSRVAGGDRYQTAIAIAKAVGQGSDTAFVATGGNFPDALAASPLAASSRSAIYLASPRYGLSRAAVDTMKASGVKKVVVLGSNLAVSDAVYNGLVADFGASAVQRLQGPTRYETAGEVSKYGCSHGLGWDQLAIATGANFPDALAGGVLQGLDSRSVLLLTPPTALHGSVAGLLSQHDPEISELHFLGSDAAVSPAVRGQVQAILK